MHDRWRFKMLSFSNTPSYGGRAGPLSLFLLKHCSAVDVYGVYTSDVLNIQAEYHIESPVTRTQRQSTFKTLGPPAQSNIDMAILLGLHCEGLINVRL